jgi:two-component sensor histidine kinase
LKGVLFDFAKRWTLRSRLMALSLAVMVPGFTILGLTEYDIWQSRQQEVTGLAVRAANQAASEVERIIDGIGAMMNTVSRAPVVVNFSEPECSSYLSNLQHNLPQITVIIVVDVAGQFRCGSVIPTSGRSFADRDYFTRAVASDAMVLGTYMVGKSSGKPAIPAALAIHGEHGEISGVVISGIDLTWLGQQLRERALPEDGSLTVADRTGTILARVPAPEKYIGTQVPQSFMPRINSATPGVTEAIGLDGVRRVLGYMPPATQRYGLYVSTGLSVEESYKAVRQSLDRGIFVAIAWAVSTLCITWFIGSRFFVRPISRLLSVIRKWRKGDQTVRTGFTSEIGEISRLGMELDRMIDQIVRDQNDKQLLADELMHRIKNTLAMVSALATSTMNKPDPGRDLLPSFLARIQALAETTDILHAKHWHGADLEKLVRAVTSPVLAGDETKAAISGPEVHLGPREAFGMTLVVHELCTNAVKHGALRTPDGTINVSWQIRDRKLSFDWTESGIDGIETPTGQGFGSKLMKRAFGQAGSVRSDFLPTGLRCEIELELGRLS